MTEETTMEAIRKKERRRDRHGMRLARRVIKDAGSPTKVGEALGVTRSAASHWGRDEGDRVHPALRDAYAVLLRLDEHPDVDARAFVRAAAEAVDLSELVHAEDETLIARGFYLLDREDSTQAAENTAARTCVGYLDACEATGHLHIELAQIGRECEARGFDLCALYRDQAVHP